MAKRKTKFERIQERLLQDLNLDCFDFRRTYIGHIRTSGGPTWVARLKESPSIEIGSAWTVTELLKKKEPLTNLDIDYRG